jgi:uncharacterized protein (TIGR02466 family)
MKLTINKVPLFPTPFWKTSIDPSDDGGLNQRLFEKILLDKIKDPQSSGKEKWHTPRNLHEDPELAELNEIVLDTARWALDSIQIKYTDLEITGCWGNVSAPGTTHHRHSHPNNYLSGVYYVQADDGANSITFHDPRPITGLIRPPMISHTAETAEVVHADVNPGDLVLFPHWLTHSVKENKSSRERISIAFNIMFSNYMSDMVKPMW